MPPAHDELNTLLDRAAPWRSSPARFAFSLAAVVAAAFLIAASNWCFGTPAAALLISGVIVSTALLGWAAGTVFAVAGAGLLAYMGGPSLLPRYVLLLVALSGATHLTERAISARIRRRLKPPLGIHGCLDGLIEGQVYGWAKDADYPARAVPVTVFVDHQPVARVAAVHFRPDVADAMNGSGRHGFYVDLRDHFQEERSALIDVRLDSGAPLAQSPALLHSPAIPVPPPRPTVLFMHIPKTAGTAFREAIAAHYALSEIAYLYPTPPGFLVDDLRALPLEQLRAFRMVIGHFQFGMHQALPQKSEYITIVRDPAARVLSQYAYAVQAQQLKIQAEDGRLLTLPEVFEKQLTTDFDNTMVRCFSGVDEREVPPGALTRDVLDLAIRNLRSAFTFVGHQEDSQYAYQWLRTHYGWVGDAGLPSVNRGTVRLAESSDSTVQQAIRHFNSWDFLLYQEIQRLYPPHNRQPSQRVAG